MTRQEDFIPPIKRSEYTRSIIECKAKSIRLEIMIAIRELMDINRARLAKHTRRDIHKQLLQRYIDALNSPDPDKGLLADAAATPEHVTVEYCLYKLSADLIYLYWMYREDSCSGELVSEKMFVTEGQIRGVLAQLKHCCEYPDELAVAGSLSKGWRIVCSAEPIVELEQEVYNEGTTETGETDGATPTVGRGEKRDFIILDDPTGPPRLRGQREIRPPGLDEGRVPHDPAND